MKKVLIFDFDNTLVRSLDCWLKMIDCDTARHFGVKPNAEFSNKRHGLGNRDTAKLFLDMHGLADTLSVQDVIDFWYAYMENKYHSVKYIAGAQQFLSKVKSKGYTLVLATATGWALLNKSLTIFDAKKYFDYIVTEDEVGRSKTFPDMFLKIMEMCKVEPSECLLFEDARRSLTTGYNLGIDGVAIISKQNKKHIGEFNKMKIVTATRFSDKLIKRLGL